MTSCIGTIFSWMISGRPRACPGSRYSNQQDEAEECRERGQGGGVSEDPNEVIEQFV